jgi:hypothetical protein
VHTVGKVAHRAGRQRDGQPRLAAATGARQGQQPVVVEKVPSMGKLVLPSHEACPRSRQTARRVPGAAGGRVRGGRLATRGTGHRRQTPRGHGQRGPGTLRWRTTILVVFPGIALPGRPAPPMRRADLPIPTVSPTLRTRRPSEPPEGPRRDPPEQPTSAGADGMFRQGADGVVAEPGHLPRPGVLGGTAAAQHAGKFSGPGLVAAGTSGPVAAAQSELVAITRIRQGHTRGH